MTFGRLGSLGSGFGRLGGAGGSSAVVPGTLIAGGGSYVWTGQDASLVIAAARSVAAGAGSYAWTGDDMTALQDHFVTAEGGSYAWTGQDATLTASSGGATTWNPSDKSASITLSGGDLVATANAGGQGVRSIAAVGASQKVYMEYVPTVNANDQQFGFALATHNVATTLGGSEGGVSKSFGVRYTGSYLDFSSADHNAAMPSWTTSNRVGIAFDRGANLFWSRVNGGAWSNSGDPAAGTGGRAVSVTGTVYACLYIGFSTEVTTARFASTDWVDAAPSGFTELA